MALVNGGTYYLLSVNEYNVLHQDGDYDFFLNYFTQITIGNDTYYYAPYGQIDPDALISQINADTTVNDPGLLSVELETAVYYSGRGFEYQ